MFNAYAGTFREQITQINHWKVADQKHQNQSNSNRIMRLFAPVKQNKGSLYKKQSL